MNIVHRPGGRAFSKDGAFTGYYTNCGRDVADVKFTDIVIASGEFSLEERGKTWRVCRSCERAE